MNYLKMTKEDVGRVLLTSPLRLWALYPNFEGYSLKLADKFQESFNPNHIDISLEITGDFSDRDFKIRYGQHGIQPLFDAHWKLTHKLSKNQPYGNPIEYVVNWNPDHKDYIYDAGDHAIRIECGNDIPKGTCKAYKLWRDTKIEVEFSFLGSMLSDIGRIESEIDKLMTSFNIREIPQIEIKNITANPHYTGIYESCHPRNYRMLIKDVEDILRVGENKEWLSDNFVSELVREYIPVNCGISEVKKHLNIRDAYIKTDNSDKGNNAVTIVFPLFYFAETKIIKPHLEITMAYKLDKMKFVTAKIVNPN
jgi:hypothetical protein